MGQKTHPIGLRLGIIRTWSSNWFARKGKYRENLLEDIKLRVFIRKELSDADVSTIEILRSPKKVTINVYTARPGVVIGQGGQRVEEFKKKLETFTEKGVQLNVLEIRRPELDATLVARGIATQIEGRISYRRAMKRAIQSAMRMGAQGIKVKCGGRLNGAEIARTEEHKDGRIPLHTLRADIDFAMATAHTTAGCVGVKVWIFNKEMLGGMQEYWKRTFDEEKRLKQQQNRPRTQQRDRKPRRKPSRRTKRES